MGKIDQKTIERIRMLREEGLTYEDIAQATGCNAKTARKYSSNIERAKSGPKLASKDIYPDSTEIREGNSNSQLVPHVSMPSVLPDKDIIRKLLDFTRSSAQSAHGIGTMSGANLTDLLRSIFRYSDGKADGRDKEIIVANLFGIAGGALGSWIAFDDMYPPSPPSTSTDLPNTTNTTVLPDAPVVDKSTSTDDVEVGRTAMQYFNEGKTPIDLVEDGVCGMNTAKVLWKDYWLFKERAKKEEEFEEKVRRESEEDEKVEDAEEAEEEEEIEDVE